MGMVVTQIVLQQCVGDCIGHHCMSTRAGMDTIAPEYCGIVIFCIHIVHAAEQIQINNTHIIKLCNFNNRITQITQGVAMNIFLGLIPILLVGHRIVPGADDRCHKIELGITKTIGCAKFLNTFAPHSYCTIDGGTVRGNDAAQFIVALSCSAEVVNTHGNGNNIRVLQVPLCQPSNITRAASISTQSSSAGTKTDIIHTQTIGQQLDIVIFVLRYADRSGDAVADACNRLSFIGRLIQPRYSVRIATGTGIGSVSLLGAGGSGDYRFIAMYMRFFNSNKVRQRLGQIKSFRFIPIFEYESNRLLPPQQFLYLSIGNLGNSPSWCC